MNSNIFSYIGASSAKPDAGALRVAIQPNMSCQGWPAAAGSIALENYIALEDATAIRLLKQAGARIVGSARMSELGFGLVGDTGSQTITENLADVALIVDNMGEARMAAARAGLMGFKPSYGVISRLGLIGLIPSMECWGILARNAAAISATMAAICVNDEQDFSMRSVLPDFGERLPAPSGVMGVAEGYESQLTKTENAAWQSALSAMGKAGFRLKSLPLPELKLFSAAHQVIGAVEASSSAGRYDGVRYGHRTAAAENWNEMYLKTRGESFGLLLKAYLFQGSFFQFKHYDAFENACRLRGRLLAETLNAFSQADWIASLTVRERRDPYQAADPAAVYEAFVRTIPANLTGLPALQLPGLALHENMDFGLQITGKPLSDPALLTLSQLFGCNPEGGLAK